MKSILIRGGRVLDPAQKRDEIADLLLADGKVVRFAPEIREAADEVIDASGLWMMPGLIDMHVHLREPGQTQKEDIASGTAAAARGGFTAVAAMPNTDPVIDSPDLVSLIRARADEVSPIRVLPIGAATIGQRGEQLADISGMAAAGAVAISEDGHSVMSAALCDAALAAAAEVGLPFLDHCEDASLAAGGCVNDDENAAREGLSGLPGAAEDIIIARDILLAERNKARLHLCHCSTEGGVRLLAGAKRRGLPVTGEVCPHHFTLTSDDRIPGDTNYKMNPPLRTFADRAAIRRGIAEGVFDVISTDHAPHTAEEKARSMEEAPFGIVGLETAVPLVITELVRPGLISPLQMAEKMSTNPAKILGLSGLGTLAEGSEADVTLIDPETAWTIDPDAFVSKGRNTPFAGRYVHGRAVAVICRGVQV